MKNLYEYNLFVSIALDVYNGEKYLCQQLDLLLSQTYQDLEVIILKYL